MRDSAIRFLRKYPTYDIYDITRESVQSKNGFYRITAVKKGRFPKSKLSNYNQYRRR